jgi:hypothetical protein
VKPVSKNKKGLKEDWRRGSSSRASALQAQSPEFKLIPQKKKKKKKKGSELES